MSNRYSNEFDDCSDDYNERDIKREQHEKKQKRMNARRLIEERHEKKRWQCELENYEY